MDDSLLPANVPVLCCPAPDPARHPDIHAAWLAAMCAVSHGAMIDGIAMHIEDFADAGAFYSRMMEIFATPTFLPMPDAVRQAAELSKGAEQGKTPPARLWRWLSCHDFAAPIEPVSGELTNIYSQPLMASWLLAPNAHIAAVRLLDARLGTMVRYAGREFEDAKISEHWSAIRAGLRSIAVGMDWARLGALMEREITLVVERRAGLSRREAGAGDGVVFEPTPSSNVPVKTPRRKRNRKKLPTEKELTPIQVETVHVVGECKGNISEAAKRLGKDRTTVREAYITALAKMGRKAPKHTTKQLRADRRGQADVSADDDRRLA